MLLSIKPARPREYSCRCRLRNPGSRHDEERDFAAFARV
jgi:hypothetical protein